jgi:hypothetical protein
MEVFLSKRGKTGYFLSKRGKNRVFFCLNIQKMEVFLYLLSKRKKNGEFFF